MTTEKLIKASNWSITNESELPDSSFAFVASDGSRHFPYKDQNGSAYLPLVRNALAGLDSNSSIPSEKRSEIKTTLQNSLKNTQASSEDVGFSTVSVIEADSTGALPQKIQLLRAGNFNTEKYGEVPISASDIQEMKANFDKGLGMAGSGETGIPIDYGHKSGENAGGWIKELTVENDALFATSIEYSGSGRKALADKEYKMISADFYPKSFGEWVDAESGVRAHNVIVGAGFTNRPMFTGNTPVMASVEDGNTGSGKQTKTVIYINASQSKETSMDIDQLRVKAAEDVSGVEQRFLQANAEKLTDDEKKKFEIIEASAVEPTVTPKPVKASEIKGDEGQVLMQASDVKSLIDSVSNLEASNKEAERKDIEKSVLAHVARGAIKADRLNSWTNRIVAAQGDERKEILADLDAMATNPVLAKEQGSSDGDEGSITDARSELMKLSLEKVEAARGTDKELSVEAAMEQVRKEKPDLALQASTQGKAQIANMTASDDQLKAAGVNLG